MLGSGRFSRRGKRARCVYINVRGRRVRGGWLTTLFFTVIAEYTSRFRAAHFLIMSPMLIGLTRRDDDSQYCIVIVISMATVVTLRLQKWPAHCFRMLNSVHTAPCSASLPCNRVISGGGWQCVSALRGCRNATATRGALTPRTIITSAIHPQSKKWMWSTRLCEHTFACRAKTENNRLFHIP